MQTKLFLTINIEFYLIKTMKIGQEKNEDLYLFVD